MSDPEPETLQQERYSAHANFMHQTKVALELIDDGAGFMWVTGTGMDEIIAVRESDGEPFTLPPGAFGDNLVSYDHIVMDRGEIPAFREAIDA